MTPAVYRYQNTAQQRTFFRGYIQWYDRNIRRRVSAVLVRTTYRQALQDAKLLLKTVKTYV